MIRSSLYLTLSILISLVIWFVGPLVAIGVWRPFELDIIRIIVIVPIMIWGLWPFIGGFIRWVVRRSRLPKNDKSDKKADSVVKIRTKGFLQTLKYVDRRYCQTMLGSWWARVSGFYKRRKPWYLVVGPEGSGKSSLIRESGLTFTLSEKLGIPAITDKGKTTSVSYWISDKAVFIDTPGQWYNTDVDQSDRDNSWGQLVRLLRRAKQRKTIDGVFVCLSANQFLSTSTEGIKSISDELRALLMSLCLAFRQDIAVYLTLTHLDGIQGGHKFLSTVDSDKISGGIGSFFEYKNSIKFTVESFEEQIQNVENSVQENILRRISNSTVRSTNAPLILFSEDMGRVREPLLSMSEQVFLNNIDAYQPHLRAYWFGSINRTEVFDHETGKVVKRIEQGTNYRSYFLNVIGERWKALGYAQSKKRNRIRRTLGFAAAFAIFIGGSGALFAQYFSDNAFINFTLAEFKRGTELADQYVIEDSQNIEILGVSNQLKYIIPVLLVDEKGSSVPFAERKRLAKTINQTYVNHLSKTLWPEINRFVESRLRIESNSAESEFYSTLKLYVMLKNPQFRDADFAVSWFETRWESYAGETNTAEDANALYHHISVVMQDEAGNFPPTETNDSLLRLARVQASNVSKSLRVIDKVKTGEWPATFVDLTLDEIGGSAASILLKSRSGKLANDVAVEKYYTKGGYFDYFLRNLQEFTRATLEEESWVLGLEDGPNRAGFEDAVQDLADEVRAEYLRQYADAWEAFLNDIGVRDATNILDAAGLAQSLGDPTSPLANIVRFAGNQVTLISNDSASADSYIDKLKFQMEQTRRDVLGEISGERLRFRIMPEKLLEDRFALLRNLRANMVSSTTAQGDLMVRNFTELHGELVRLDSAIKANSLIGQTDRFARIRSNALVLPDPIKSVMIELADIGLGRQTAQNAHRLSVDVVGITSGLCAQSQVAGFPFKKSSASDVSVDEFVAAFAPDGEFQKYMTKNLEGKINKFTNPWQSEIDESTEKAYLSEDVVRSFELADQMSKQFFNEMGNFGIKFTIEPVDQSSNITRSVLNIDGASIDYMFRKTAPIVINWPGDQKGFFVQLTTVDINGGSKTISFDGPWAIYRLLESSSVATIAHNQRRVRVSTPSGTVTYLITTDAAEHPFWSDTLTKFTCPTLLEEKNGS